MTHTTKITTIFLHMKSIWLQTMTVSKILKKQVHVWCDEKAIIENMNGVVQHALEFTAEELAAIDAFELSYKEPIDKEFFGSGDLFTTDPEYEAKKRRIFRGNEVLCGVLDKVIRHGQQSIASIQLMEDTTHAWVSVRIPDVELARGEYDIPRWHTDGPFYKSDHPQAKCVVALKGPGTRFCIADEETRQALNDTCFAEPGYDWDMCRRKQTHELLLQACREKKATMLQAPTLTATCFLTGDLQTATIHSEPVIDASRIFVSVVPGSHAEISQKMKGIRSL
jgi:hypothetical protein